MNNKPFGDYASFEDWLDATRISLSNEIRGMTPEEEINYLNEKNAPLMKKYGFIMSDLQPVRPHKRERIAG